MTLEDFILDLIKKEGPLSNGIILSRIEDVAREAIHRLTNEGKLWIDLEWRINICEGGMNDSLTEKRKRALDAFRAVLGWEYPMCWTVSKGDFSGRDVAIDVFNVPVDMQMELLRRLREIRKKIQDFLGSDCLFVFHTPEATKEHYLDIVTELLKSWEDR